MRHVLLPFFSCICLITQAQSPQIHSFKFENAETSTLPRISTVSFWGGRLGAYHFIDVDPPYPDLLESYTRHVHPDSLWQKSESPQLPFSNLGAYAFSIGRNRLWKTLGNLDNCPGSSSVCRVARFYLSTPQAPDPVVVLNISNGPVDVNQPSFELLNLPDVLTFDSLKALVRFTHSGSNGGFTAPFFYKTSDGGLTWQMYDPPIWPVFDAKDRYAGVADSVVRLSTSFDFLTHEDWPMPKNVAANQIGLSFFSNDTLFLLTKNPGGRVWFSADKGQQWQERPSPFPDLNNQNDAHWYNNGTIWFSNYNIGFYRTRHPFTAAQELLSANRITNPYHNVLFFDLDGSVILNTDIGLLKIDAGNDSIQPYYNGLLPGGDLLDIQFYNGQYWGKQSGTLYTSNDGILWTPYHHPQLNHLQVSNMVVLGDQAYVTAHNSYTDKKSLLFSVAGSDWMPVDSLPYFSPNNFVYFKDQWVLVVEGTNSIYRSKDQGKTWAVIKAPSNFVLNRSGVVAFGDTLLVVDGRGRLLRSVDAGLQWTSLQSPVASTFDVYPAMVVQGTNLYLGSRFGPLLFRSFDRGITWDTVNTTFLMNSWALTDSLLVLVNSSNSNQQGVYLSADEGRNWYWTAEPPYPDHAANFDHQGNRFVFSNQYGTKAIYAVESDSLFQDLFNLGISKSELPEYVDKTIVWSIAPNPGDDKVCFSRYGKLANPGFVHITDVYGKGVKSGYVSDPCMAIGDLPAGLYYVHFRFTMESAGIVLRLVVR